MNKFYILGDMGSGSKSQKNVSNAMYEHIKETNHKDTFVCGLGDNIYECGCSSIDDVQFEDKFEEPYRNIPDDIKFYMCLGNHDYGDIILGGHPIHQINYGIESQKMGKKWYMPSSYYTFKKGNIEFFVIDTNFDEPNYTDDINNQLQYLIQKINASKAKWKVVYGHHTWRSIAGHGNADDKLEGFLDELLKKATFDVYMCGHDHNKQVINMNLHDKDVTLIVCGTGGKVYHDLNNYENLNDSDLIFSSSNLGYGYCEEMKNRLIFIFYNEKNDIEFIHPIDK